MERTAQKAELHTAICILTHVYVVDRIFEANLQHKGHGYAATNAPETPGPPPRAARLIGLRSCRKGACNEEFRVFKLERAGCGGDLCAHGGAVGASRGSAERSETSGTCIAAEDGGQLDGNGENVAR
jgi:hypothetical protein